VSLCALQSHGKRKNQRTQNVRENYCRFGFGTEMEAKKYIPPLLPKRKKKVWQSRANVVRYTQLDIDIHTKLAKM
jgi:hypothetical protein